jgi:purine-binding chemotaxis protein CheW
MATTQQLCTFSVNGIHFGVDVLHVQEVIRAQSLTRVPLADDAVTGLMNLRGQIVTAVDLRTRLGIAARNADMLPTNVILRTVDGAVSLLVDDIGDVIDVDADAVERVPSSVSGAVRQIVTGVHKLHGSLLMVLDPDRAVDLGVPA